MFLTDVNSARCVIRIKFGLVVMMCRMKLVPGKLAVFVTPSKPKIVLLGHCNHEHYSKNICQTCEINHVNSEFGCNNCFLEKHLPNSGGHCLFFVCKQFKCRTHLRSVLKSILLNGFQPTAMHLMNVQKLLSFVESVKKTEACIGG